jgi:TctA family transporter
MAASVLTAATKRGAASEPAADPIRGTARASTEPRRGGRACRAELVDDARERLLEMGRDHGGEPRLVAVIGLFGIGELLLSMEERLRFESLKARISPRAVLATVVAMVLGDKAEDAFRQSMIMSHGSLAIFWSNALVATLVALAGLLLLSPLITAGMRRLLPARPST